MKAARKSDEYEQYAKGGVYKNNSKGIQSLRTSQDNIDTQLITSETYKTSYTNQFNEKNARRNNRETLNLLRGANSNKNSKDKPVMPIDVTTSPVNSRNNDEFMQWAGELHQRTDFNKKRDRLTNWTNIMFKV